ncbi:MAG: hypothetical protein JSW60_08200 [Thermoplasmatales archaeon]|nr:MAG: hypothetical protein JSW60_08200 [Thermoplasmatales archaeon]
MNEKEFQDYEDLPKDKYKTLETRLYGELMRSCQRYSTKLRIISILGILDFVKQEIMNLEKENMKFKDAENPEEKSNITFDE